MGSLFFAEPAPIHHSDMKINSLLKLLSLFPLPE